MRSGDEEIVELVNVVLDGEATPEEENELNDLLRVSEQAREINEGIRGVVAELQAVAAVQPPEALKRDVMDATRRTATVISFDPARSRRRVLFGLAWAAAAAIILAVLLVDPSPFASRRGTATDARATMAPAGAANWPIVARIDSHQPGSDATLVVRRSGDLYLVEPQVPGPRPMTILVGWDSKKVSFIGFLGAPDPLSWKDSAQFTLQGPADRAGVIVRPRSAGGAEFRVAVGETDVIRSVVPLE